MNICLKYTSKNIQGSICLPSSKSISNRVLMIKWIVGKDVEIENLSKALDTKLLDEFIFKPNQSNFDVGNAGTVMRFLTAFLATQQGIFYITGSNRMKNRPIQILVEALKKMGAQIEYTEKEGYPPLKIVGKQLNGGKISIDQSVSSQYISALMLIAPTLAEGLEISFENKPTSTSYIKMTAEIMREFDCRVEFEHNIYQEINRIKIKSNRYFPKKIKIESDWSSASYWYSVVALSESANILLEGLKSDSIQGDSIVSEFYSNFGVHTEFTSEGARLTKSNGIKINERILNFDFISCPDIAQTVAVTCAALNVPAKLTGLSTLRIKETDRVSAIRNELTKLGFEVDVEGNDIFIHHVSKSQFPKDWSNVSISTYNDHRMAMAFAPLGLISPITIEDIDVVEKSYPDFWKDLKQVGFSISEKL